MATIREQAEFDANRLYSISKSANWILQSAIWLSGVGAFLYGTSFLGSPLTNMIGVYLLLLAIIATIISSVGARVLTYSAMVKAQTLRVQLGLLESEAHVNPGPLFPTSASLFPKTNQKA
jgi:membrane protein YdbS with pleckstrin-like domain